MTRQGKTADVKGVTSSFWAVFYSILQDIGRSALIADILSPRHRSVSYIPDERLASKPMIWILMLHIGKRLSNLHAAQNPQHTKHPPVL